MEDLELEEVEVTVSKENDLRMVKEIETIITNGTQHKRVSETLMDALRSLKDFANTDDYQYMLSVSYGEFDEIASKVTKTNNLPESKPEKFFVVATCMNESHLPLFSLRVLRDYYLIKNQNFPVDIERISKDQTLALISEYWKKRRFTNKSLQEILTKHGYRSHGAKSDLLRGVKAIISKEIMNPEEDKIEKDSSDEETEAKPKKKAKVADKQTKEKDASQEKAKKKQTEKPKKA